MKNVLDLLHQKFQYGIFFGLPQTNDVALSKGEKSRMFKEHHKKLVLKYFCGKNTFLLFFSELFETDVWNIFTARRFCSDLFFSGYFF